MDLTSYMSNPIFAWVILPILIIIARILDVSMGTLRIVYLNRGYKILAAAIGFGEVLIWVIVIAQVMQNLNNIVTYLAYATGFAIGTMVGLILEEKLSIGQVVVRVITQKDASELIESLNANNFGATALNAAGAKGPVQVVLMVVNRTDLPKVTTIVRQFNPAAFYTIENVRTVVEGIFPDQRGNNHLSNLKRIFTARK
jgi:uncharacterized protein YebE (UPF0316 family)